MTASTLTTTSIAIALEVEAHDPNVSNPSWAMLLLDAPSVLRILALKEALLTSLEETVEYTPTAAGVFPTWLPLASDSTDLCCMTTAVNLSRTGISFEAVIQSEDETCSTVELAWDALQALLANRSEGYSMGNCLWLTDSLMFVANYVSGWSRPAAIDALWDAIGEEIEYADGEQEPAGEPEELTRLRDFIPSHDMPA